MNFSKKLFLLLTFFIFTSVQAGIYIEPYTGYNFGTMDLEKDLSGSTPEYIYSGPAMGLRLGGSFLGFQLGAEYGLGSYTMAWDEVPDGITLPEYSVSNMGVFAGFSFPILIRAWATYYLSSTLEDQDGNVLNGSGYVLGVGFRPIPIPLPFVSVSFNLEYRQITIDEEEDSGGNPTALDGSVNEIVLSISAPINI